MLHARKIQIAFVDNGDLVPGTPLGSYTQAVKKLQDGGVHPTIASTMTLDYGVAISGRESRI
ncbi:MAG: hypothetical protein ABS948_04815 [Solibacillus sp.]